MREMQPKPHRDAGAPMHGAWVLPAWRCPPTPRSCRARGHEQRASLCRLPASPLGGAGSLCQAALAILCPLWPSWVTDVPRERSRAWARHGDGRTPPCTPSRSRGLSGPPSEDRQRRACLARPRPYSTAGPSPRPPAFLSLARFWGPPLGCGSTLTAAPTGVSLRGYAQ